MKPILAHLQQMAQILRRYSGIFLLCVAGMFLSYATFTTVNYYEDQYNLQQFQASFKDKIKSLTQVVSAIDKVFLATQSMLEIKEALEPEDFSSLITDNFLHNTGIQGVEWAPSISRSQIISFEHKVNQTSHFNYLIREVEYQSTRCDQQEMQNIFPVLFAQPSKLIGHELGLQLESDCTIANSMKKAMQSKAMHGSNFFNAQNELALRLLLPVFTKNSASPDKLRGFIVGIVMINQLIDGLWGDLTKSPNYQVTIFNQSDHSKKIYESNRLEFCAQNCDELQEHFKLQESIRLANQVWVIELSKFSKGSHSRIYAYMVAILILVMTFGFSIYLWTNINRVRWAKSIVKERTKSLEFQARHDDLTQLLNKKSLTTELEKLTTQRNRRNDQGFSLLFIDLDHFKKINDTKGHLVGDKLLQQVAQRLKQTARFDDLLFRFGGDEFAVLLHNSFDKAMIRQVAERILKRLEQVYIVDDNKYRIGASIGVTVVDKSDVCASVIIRNADIAMYEAKSQGRGKVIFYRSDMYKCLVYKQYIEDELADAIKNQHMFAYLQPIHENQELKGFEALSRWQHPDKGLILPDDFITVAEETGLIHTLGNWLIDSACAQLSVWQKAFGEHCPYISINISAIQLSQPDVVEKIASALQHYQVPGKLLAVELTESALIDNKVIVKENLTKLRALGIRIFLDDFGTGFSSLSLLQDFPIDVLKIDRSFVLGIDENNQDSQQLVKAMINMAQALNMQVVAEGVENINTLNWLRDASCHTIQGYFFAKPLSAQELDSYLKNNSLLPDNHAPLASVVAKA